MTVIICDYLECQETTQHAFDLRARPNAALAFPVPVLRPVQVNSCCAMDLHPNGSPAPNANNGITWIDCCDGDLTAGDLAGTSVPCNSARLQMGPCYDAKGDKVPGVFVGHCGWGGAVSDAATRYDLAFGVNHTAMWGINYNGVLFPYLANTYQIGSSSNACSAIYSYSFVNPCDARLKDVIGVIDDAVKRAARSVAIYAFHWKDNPDGPICFGPLAQDIIAAFELEGLDAFDYGLVQQEGDGPICVNLTQFAILRSM